MRRQEQQDQSGGVRAVDRALDLLELLAQSNQALRIADIVQQLDLKRTTVYRLLTTLLARGYVEPGKSGATYQLGLRTLEIGSRFAVRLDLRSAAMPALQLLAETTGDTAYLLVNGQGEAFCLDRVDGKNHLKSLFLQVGGRMPLSTGAGPRVLLASLPQEDLEQVIQNTGLPCLTPHSITDPALLRHDLAQIRKQDYAVSHGDATLGVSAIGAPVRNHQSRVVAAISVGGPSNHFTDNNMPSMIALVTKAASETSARLGYTTGFAPAFKNPPK